MKNLVIIKVIVFALVVFTSANVIFASMSERGHEAVVAAYRNRYDLSVAVYRLRVSSAEMTRIIRAYASLGEGDQPHLFQLQLISNRANQLRELIDNDPNITSAERHLMANVIASQMALRLMDGQAFTLIAAGRSGEAVDLVYGREYRDYGIRSTSYMLQLAAALDIRLGNEITTAERRSNLFEMLALVAVILFAAVSVLGLVYLYYQVKAYNKRENEAKIMNEFILASSPLTISMWNHQRRPVYINARGKALLGLATEQDYLDGWFNYAPQLQPCGTPSGEKINQVFDTVVREGFHRFEWTHLSVDGEYIPSEVHLVRLMQDDKPMIVVYVTDLRQALAAMQQEQALAEARSESQAKTRFLARMSHEIRTPLSSIMGITEIQLQKGRHSADTNEAFLRIHNSSDVLLTIINDILDLAKVEAGKMEIVDEPYEVASMIVDTMQLNLIYIGSKGIDFKMKVDENLPTHLIGDALRIKQVLNNLLSNAFKYTQKGTVTISIRVEKGAAADEVIVTFQVTDTGMGMTPEQLDTLFSEYARGDGKQIRLIEGTGLGMSIASHLITMMNGNMQVESTVNVGTTITVRIPQKVDSSYVLGRETAESLEKLKDSHKTALRRGTQINYEPMPYGRVLVVDDVESNLYVARGLLIPYKLQVETVTSGQDAIDKIKAGQVYDIIFMDHMMPQMDGMQAGCIIRDMGYDQPIVALTANTVKGQADKFLSQGFAGFISKPIDVNVLNATLLRYIRDKQTQEVINEARKLVDTTPASVATHISAELERIFLQDVENVLRVLTPLVQAITNGQEVDDDTRKILATQAHAIKSALANVGQSTLSDAAYNLEKAAKNNRIDLLRQDAPLFIQSLKNVADALHPTEMAIYVIDDVETNLYMTKAVLQEQYAVVTASSGAKALALMEKIPPGLILLDFDMPEMSGPEVLAHVKASPKLAHVPVIFLSGMEEEEIRDEGLKKGAVDFITKPFDPSELLEKVRLNYYRDSK